ncbi:hypothetical protein KA050_04065 [Candidatus Gracilibacteria bacterium]|nr:hypothetical protein [Candidatus Gracilibacteria bacterium]
MVDKKFTSARGIPYSLNTVEEFDDFIARAEASPSMTFEEINEALAFNLKKVEGMKKHSIHS